MILFEFSPFAKEILDKTQNEFVGKPISRCTMAEVDNRILFVEHLLAEYDVSELERQLFMQIYTKALREAIHREEKYY